MIDQNKIIEYATQVLSTEISCLADLQQELNSNGFTEAVVAIHRCRGKVVVCGLGKSGIVARKIAATLSSTGTSAFFMHPTEAYHGDLGMVSKGDLILMLSHSGETDELLRLIPFFKQNGNTVVSISGNKTSTMAKNACHNIHIPVKREACPLELAPTASTTAAMAMGDAIAITLMRLNNFDSSDFALFHPGGSLGKRLLTSAADIMRSTNLPIVGRNSSMADVVNAIGYGRIGAAIVVSSSVATSSVATSSVATSTTATSNDSNVVGIITDGDLRRELSEGKAMAALFDKTAEDIMTKNPKTVLPSTPVAEIEGLMVRYKITTLIVVENNQLRGVVEYYDFGA